jgi:EmrB/QacA subfamily drug resistance transporter
LSTARARLESPAGVRTTFTVPAATTNARRTLLASCGGTFVVTFDGAAVQMIMPALRRALHTDIRAVEWVMTAYLLVTTAAYLPAGRLGDNLGRARVWRVGLASFVVASAACMLATTLPWLVAARVAQALGAAAITANSAPLLLAAFPVEKRARALALGGVAIGLGLLLGPAAGALLAGTLSWRLLFAVAVPLGIGVALVGRGALPERRPLARPFDVAGGLLSAAGLGALVVGAASARQARAGLPPSVLLVIGLLLLVLFVAWELRRAQPLIELRLFERRSFLVGTLTALLTYAALFTATAALPFFLVDVQRRSLVQSGLLVAVIPVALALAAPLSGWATDRLGARWPCALGLFAVAAGLLVGGRLPADAGAGWTVAAMALVGAGIGAYESPNSAASLSALGSDDFGVGAATLGVARNLGMTAGAALAGTLLGRGGGVPAATAATANARADGAAELGAVHTLLLIGALGALAAALCALLRPSGNLAARVPRGATPRATESPVTGF